jgi:hypothetical protein
LFHADFFLRAIPWSRLILRTGKVENSLNISRVARIRVALSGAMALSAVLSVFLPWMLWLVVAMAVALFVCDWTVLKWFAQKRGIAFAAAVIPWHWFSHFYSGCGLVVAMVQHTLAGAQANTTEADVPVVSAN